MNTRKHKLARPVERTLGMLLWAAVFTGVVFAQEVAVVDGGGFEDVLVREAFVQADAVKAWSLLRQADTLIQKGDTNATLAAVRAAALLAPENKGVQTKVSTSYALAGKAAEAYEARKRVLAMDPDNLEHLRAIAQLANWVGKPAEAAAALERIVELDPEDEKALLDLARSYSWSGELDESATAYSQYVSGHQEEHGVLLEWARVESWRGNFVEALNLLATYGELSGDSSTVERARGRFLASADRPSEALETLDRLLAETPEDFELSFSRTVALHYQRKPAQVADSIKRLRELRPDSTEVDEIDDFVNATDRTRMEGGIRYYWDTDDLEHTRVKIVERLQLSPRTSIEGRYEANHLRADKGSGLERENGLESIDQSSRWIGIINHFSPALQIYAVGGETHIRGEEEHFAFRVRLDSRPADSLILSAEADRDLLMISPRSMSLGIVRTYGKASVEWRPDLIHTVVASVRYDDYSDDNRRLWIAVAPRRTVLRREHVNLDLGMRYLGLDFSDDLDNGYYDPSWYRQFALTAFTYLKGGADRGVSIVAAAGVYREATSEDWEFGWSIDSEATLGAFDDWMLKATFSIVENLRADVSAFQARAVGAAVTRRF